MYDPPAYVWALAIGGPAAIAAATCIALYSGAVRAGLGRRRTALLGGDDPAATRHSPFGPTGKGQVMKLRHRTGGSR